MDDRTLRLEADIDRIARAGRAAPLGGSATCSAFLAFRRARAVTRTSLWKAPAPAQPNTDNVLVREVSLRDSSAVLVVISRGNSKYNANACVCAAAVVAFDQVFAAPLLADADVAPALRRAMLAADEAIFALRGAEIAPPICQRLQVACGTRFGSPYGSAIALVATAAQAWLAHVGDNRAYLLPREGTARQLVHPHVLANEADFRASAGAEERRLAGDVASRLLGSGSEHDVRMDVTRVPLAAGERIVLGNATVAQVPPTAGTSGDDLLQRMMDLPVVDDGIPTSLAVID